jgi:isopenicillin N synthase-like dioxygenase
MFSVCSQVPIVDFGRFLKGNASERQATGEEVLNAFKNVGFVYLAQHSIPASQLANVFDHSKRFFELSPQEKTKLAWVSPQANRGYVAPGREKVTQLTDKAAVTALREASPDLKESLEIGKEPSTDFHNNWPAHDPSFRPAMMRFFADCHALHLDVLDAVALGLGLTPRFFVPFCDKMDHNLRLLHYPGVPRSLLDKGEQARAGAHTDYGSITLLFQDGQGGLQVTARRYLPRSVLRHGFLNMARPQTFFLHIAAARLTLSARHRHGLLRPRQTKHDHGSERKGVEFRHRESSQGRHPHWSALAASSRG